LPRELEPEPVRVVEDFAPELRARVVPDDFARDVDCERVDAERPSPERLRLEVRFEPLFEARLEEPVLADALGPVPRLLELRDPERLDVPDERVLPALRDDPDFEDRLAATREPLREAEAERERLDEERPRALVLPREEERPDERSCAVSREISLLKLLFCPRAVVSWCSSASPRSSNFSKKSFQEIGCNEFAPL
jgi:hypothetical protein